MRFLLAAVLAAAILVTSSPALLAQAWEPPFAHFPPTDFPPDMLAPDANATRTRCVEKGGGRTDCVTTKRGRIVARTVCRIRGGARVCDTVEY